jgi:outer membrane protein OmpA-like peptidoglycan-associated protein
MPSASTAHEWSPAPRAAFRSREDWSLRWWMMFAVILSIGFHGLLYVSFETFGIGQSEATVSQPPVRDRISIAEELLREQKAITEVPEIIAPGNEPDIKAFDPKMDEFEKASQIPENQEIDLTPNVKEITNFIRADDPGDGAVAASALPAMAQMLAPQSLATPDVAAEMASVRRDILSKPVSERQMLLDAGVLEPGEGGKVDMGLLDTVKTQGAGADAAGARVKGFSNLDDLLSQGGGRMGGSTAPILMPTDLLFQYGSDQLAEGARLSLMKLGMLIQKNPDSVFIVEGHTDSFGSEDFNDALSLRRAQAVVNWLQDSLRLATDRVLAEGKGERALLSDANGTVEEQSLNRRVEIKVRKKR